MKPEDHLFRSAVMGGFNREDVTAYLEKMSAAHSEELEGLRRELETAQSGREEAERALTAAREEGERQRAQIAALTAERGDLQRERAELRAGLDGTHQEVETLRRALEEEKAKTTASAGELTSLKAQVTVLAEVQRALAQKSEALAHAEEELRTLRGQQEALAADADAFHAVKERVAGIELEAHQRAQDVEDEARRHAEEARQGVERWLGAVRREYHTLHAAMDAAVERTRQELSAIGEDARQIAERFAAGEDALDGIVSQYRAATAPETQEPEEE